MKRYALILLLAAGCSKAGAQALPPPDQLTQAQADALYRIADEVPKLRDRLKKLEGDYKKILADLQINEADVGNTVGWDLETLKITRIAKPGK